jgi:hypothetical protein
MAKRSIKATFSNGVIITRTTTLALTHAWRFVGRHHPDNASQSGGDICLTGFASSRALAAKAMSSESRHVTKPSHWNKNKVGETVSTEIVEVETADKPRDDGTAIEPGHEPGA